MGCALHRQPYVALQPGHQNRPTMAVHASPAHCDHRVHNSQLCRLQRASATGMRCQALRSNGDSSACWQLDLGAAMIEVSSLQALYNLGGFAQPRAAAARDKWMMPSTRLSSRLKNSCTLHTCNAHSQVTCDMLVHWQCMGTVGSSMFQLRASV